MIEHQDVILTAFCGLGAVLAAAGAAWIHFRGVTRYQHQVDQSLQKEREHLEALIKRYPFVLRMDKLAKKDIVQLIEDAPEDVLAWMALGAASLAARGDTAAEEIVEKKAAYLAGELAGSVFEQALGEAMQEASYDWRTSTPRTMTPLQRAAYSGCATDGRAAFACALTHFIEARREQVSDQSKEERDRLLVGDISSADD